MATCQFVARGLSFAVKHDGTSGHTAPSVWYLDKVLAEEVRAKFPAGAQDKTVHDIEPEVIRKKGPSAYVDALVGEDHVGDATHMLSYSWGCRMLGLIIPTLLEFCAGAGLETKRTYVWMCCLCIDQHQVQERRRQNQTVSFDEFHAIFGSRVIAINHILSLMSPWAKPTYLERVWCVFELHTAFDVGADVTVLMPPEERSSLCKAMLDDTQRKTIYQAVASVDIETAESTVPADKQHILQLVRGDDGKGTEKLNVQTRKKCKALYLDVLSCELERVLGDPRSPHPMPGPRRGRALSCDLDVAELCELCIQVSMMVYDGGEPSRAFGLVAKGLRALDPGDPPRKLAGARLLTQRGFLQSKDRQLKESRATFERARRLLGDLGAAESEHAARVSEGLGGVHRKERRINQALAELSEGYRIHENLGTLGTMKALTLIYNLGLVRFELGNWDDAGRLFDQARGVREREGTLNTPGGSLLLEAVARLQERQGKLAEAIATCEDARHCRVVSGTLQTPAGACLCALIGFLKVRGCEWDDVLGAYRSAEEILRAIGKLDSRLGREVSESIRFVRRILAHY